MVKKWINELRQCTVKGDIYGAVKALNKITRLVVIEAFVGFVMVVAISGIYTCKAIKIRQEYAAKASTLPAYEDIVGNTYIRVEADGEEYLLVCGYVKIIVSDYDGKDIDIVHDEQYEWVDVAKHNPAIKGTFDVRFNDSLITVVKYYYDYNDNPYYATNRYTVVHYDFSFSYPHDNLTEDTKDIPIVTAQ